MKGVATACFAGLAAAACHNSNASEQSATAHARDMSPARIVAAAAGDRDAFLPDFSYAGYGFGLGEIPTPGGKMIDPAEYGALPDDGIDDSDGLLAALEAARKSEGPVSIQLRPGRYVITEVLALDRSDLILRGAGRHGDGTELHFPRPLRMVDTGSRFNELREYLVKYEKRQREPDRNLDVLFSEYSWTGGFLWVGREDDRAVPYLEEYDEKKTPEAVATEGERGGLTLIVDDASGLNEGQWIDIAWYSTDPNSGIIGSIYGETHLEIGSHHWSFPKRPLVRHRTKVTAIDGNTLTLASPLPHPASSEVPAEITTWQPLERIGIENLRLTFPQAAVFGHHVEQGYNGIYFTGAADGWARNLTVTNADAGILTDDAANLTFSEITFDGTRRAHYAVHMGSVGNVLAERIDVFVPVIHSLTFNTKSVRSVYKDSTVWKEPVIDQHAGSNHQNLFDNITLHLAANPSDDGPAYKVFDGSGAPYWQPGHGRYNTIWNLRLDVEGGVAPGETLNILGLAEGPDARVIGLHANHALSLDYRPEPVVSHLGQRVRAIPSLYDYQLMRRQSE